MSDDHWFFMLRVLVLRFHLVVARRQMPITAIANLLLRARSVGLMVQLLLDKTRRELRLLLFLPLTVLLQAQVVQWLLLLLHVLRGREIVACLCRQVMLAFWREILRILSL